MKSDVVQPKRTVRSFVIREGRFTQAQKNAFTEFWPHYGIPLEKLERVVLSEWFNHPQATVLDVGFGSGDSLISLAQERKDINFIGVEVYRPGIGAVLRRLKELEIDNVRIINGDILDLINNKLDDACLQGALVWFPDPWPKKRHHKRRLVQKAFLQTMSKVIKPTGIIHLASDWQPYVAFMQEHATGVSNLKNLQCSQNPLGLKRPTTRFEQRGLRKGHKVSDLFYEVI